MVGWVGRGMLDGFDYGMDGGVGCCMMDGWDVDWVGGLGEWVIGWVSG